MSIFILSLIIIHVVSSTIQPALSHTVPVIFYTVAIAGIILLIVCCVLVISLVGCCIYWIKKKKQDTL